MEVIMSKDRVAKIKQKYGAHIFQRWGEKGGSPVLRAYREGRVIIRKK